MIGPAESRPLPTLREALVALAAYVAIALWYWWPMVVDPDAVWSVGRDFFQNSWNLWWVGETLASDAPLQETDRLFHPQGTSLAFHTLSPATTIPGWVLMKVFGLSVGAAYAVIFVAAFPISGLGAWLLARHLTGSGLAALVAGLFFAFNPYHTAMVPQLNNVQFQWMPLAVLGIVRVLEGGSWRAMLLAGVATGLCGGVDLYQPVFVGCAAAVLAPAYLIRRKRLKDLAVWGKLAGAAAVAFVMMLPGLLPMLELLRAGEGPAGLDSPIRYAGEVQLLGMRPKGTVAHFFWPVILGWTTLLALGWTLIRVRRSVAPGWWLLALVAFLLMQGARLTIFNSETPVPMPMAAFVHIPLLEFVRVPHRFLLVLLLAIVGILARGLAELEVRRGAPVLLVLAALMAAELRPASPDAVSMARAPVYQQMAEDSEDYAVLELPLDFRDGYPMYLQTMHGKALVGGYTSHILPGALEGLRSSLIRALLPARHDNDVLGLPEHLDVDVDGLDEETLDAWRRELVVDKRVRYIVLRRAADFLPSEAVRPPGSTAAKLRLGLTPFCFNSSINDLQTLARPRVAEFRAQLVAESGQAVALVQRMFGDPDPALGTLGTDVWDLRSYAEGF